MQISIVIPTYNRADLLPVAVNSVKGQTSGDWELIVVDDGSEDNTREIMADYLEDTRINYVFQPHQGVAVARNTGVENAGGSYIIFLDSDDKFHPDLLKTVYTTGKDKYDVIFWEVLKIIDGKQQIWKPKNLGGLYNHLIGTFLAGSACFRKSLFRKVGGYDPKMTFGENYELGLRISQQENLRTRIIHKPLLVYEIKRNYRTSNSLNNRLTSGLHQYKKHKESYDENPEQKGEMNYLIGYVLEKTGDRNEALKYYQSSFRSNPLNYKAFLKVIYLFCFK